MNMNNDAAELGSIVHRNLRRKKVGLGPLGLLSFLGITMGVLILMAMAAPSARAALLTYYDFEDMNLTSDSPGLQTTNISVVSGSLGLSFPAAGTNVNAVTPSTNVAAFPTPAAGTGAASFTLGGLTTTGLTDIALSFAILSGGTGTFTDLGFFYSTTGLNGPYTHFATFGNLQIATTYTAFSIPDVSALTGGAVDGVSGSKLFFEFAFSGAAVESLATTHIDNIQVTAVPEPRSYVGALFGLVGLCWYQRRRFAQMFASRVKANSVVAV